MRRSLGSAKLALPAMECHLRDVLLLAQFRDGALAGISLAQDPDLLLCPVFLPFMSGSFLAQTNSQGGLKIRGHVSSLPGNTALSVAYPRASEVKRSSSTSETGDSEEFTTDKPHHAVTAGRIAGLKIHRPLKSCGFDPHPGHQR